MARKKTSSTFASKVTSRPRSPGVSSNEALAGDSQQHYLALRPALLGWFWNRCRYCLPCPDSIRFTSLRYVVHHAIQGRRSFGGPVCSFRVRGSAEWRRWYARTFSQLLAQRRWYSAASRVLIRHAGNRGARERTRCRRQRRQRRPVGRQAGRTKGRRRRRRPVGRRTARTSGRHLRWSWLGS